MKNISKNIFAIYSYNFLFLTLFSLTFFSISLPAQATKVKHTSVSLNAHVHGLSELTIAIENQQIEISISSPAANIVGFEHKAVSNEEMAIVEKAQSLLESEQKLFIFSGAECTLIKREIDMSDLLSGMHTTDDHDESDHDESAHVNKEHQETEHDAKHHADLHSHQHKNSDENLSNTTENHEKHSVHSEVVANYQFNCAKMTELSAITVEIFELFSGVEEIDAMWITPSAQGATTLNINNNKIRL